MSWLQTRKARKELEKLGLSKSYLKDMEGELKQGYKQAKGLRKELRKQESPEYHQLIETLNKIKDGTAPNEQKRDISFTLVKQSSLIDREKHDLLEQVEGLYNASN